MIDALNNREMSLFVWGVIAMIFILTLKDARRGLFNLLKLAASKKFLGIYFCVLAYTAAVIFFLYKIQLWDASQIKNTAVWLIFSALPTLFKSQGAYKEKHYFKKEIRDIFGRTAIVEFFVNVYSFHLLVELFVVPCLIFLGAMFSLANRQKI